MPSPLYSLLETIFKKNDRAIVWYACWVGRDKAGKGRTIKNMRQWQLSLFRQMIASPSTECTSWWKHLNESKLRIFLRYQFTNICNAFKIKEPHFKGVPFFILKSYLAVPSPAWFCVRDTPCDSTLFWVWVQRKLRTWTLKFWKSQNKHQSQILRQR